MDQAVRVYVIVAYIQGCPPSPNPKRYTMKALNPQIPKPLTCRLRDSFRK